MIKSMRLLVIPALLGISGCSEKEPALEPVVRPFKIHTVGQIEIRTNEYPGAVAASQHAEMAFEVPGRILEFLVDQGDRVEEGAH